MIIRITVWGKRSCFIDRLKAHNQLASYKTFLSLFAMLHPITISANIQSGAPVFTSTRVPVKNLFDYLKKGYSLDNFLEDFPSIKKEHAIQVLEHFEKVLNSYTAENV